MRDDTQGEGSVSRPAGLGEWRRGGAFFAHRGERIFCRAAGEAGAPVLLLVHGFPTASWDWAPLWPALAREYRVLALDLIGFGFSAKPAGHDYRTADQAELCEALLSARGVREFHLLAHDYGDTVAQELLARQREPGGRPRLASVCFLNGGLFPEAYRPRLIQRLLLSPVGPLIARRMTRARFARSMRALFGRDTPPSEELLAGFWELVTCNDGLAVVPRIIRYMRERERQRERWVGALVRADVPLKLIDGAADPISGVAMAQRYGELVPRADVTLLPGIGHYPQLEAPAAVLEAYRAFRARDVGAT
jgi:pimeloyl-ACP methyl ester carboxylesterase